MRRIRTCDLQLTGPKTTTPKKFEKITKKKLFIFFLKKRKFSQKKSLKIPRGTRNNQNKAMSIFRDITKKHDFFLK